MYRNKHSEKLRDQPRVTQLLRARPCLAYLFLTISWPQIAGPKGLLSLWPLKPGRLLRSQPGGNVVPAGTGSATASKDGFN